MKISAGTRHRRIALFLEKRTGDTFSANEVEKFRREWINNTKSDADTEMLSQSEFLFFLESVGI